MSKKSSIYGHTLILVFLDVAVLRIQGHGFLAEPPARNYVRHKLPPQDSNKEWNPASLNGDGTGNVKSRANGKWPSPPEAHGLCGDPCQNRKTPSNWKDEEYMKPSAPQKTYTAGDIIEFKVCITVGHGGHHEFRICDKGISPSTISSPADGQACLNKWTLKRAPLEASCQPNGNADCQPIIKGNEHRWYEPPGGSNVQQAYANWTDDMYEPPDDMYEPMLFARDGNVRAMQTLSCAKTYKMRYKIPDDLSCERCTLQWYWVTANTCLYDEKVISYFREMKNTGWNANAWCPNCFGDATCATQCCGDPPAGNTKYGEEFWNCADITIKAKDGGGGAGRRRKDSEGGGDDEGRRRRRSEDKEDSRRRRSKEEEKGRRRRRSKEEDARRRRRSKDKEDRRRRRSKSPRRRSKSRRRRSKKSRRRRSKSPRRRSSSRRRRRSRRRRKR